MTTVLDRTILESLVPVSQERIERVEGRKEGLGGKSALGEGAESQKFKQTRILGD